MTKRHLAFDLGAESGRAIVGEIENGKLELCEIHRFETQGMSVNGSLRWDVYRLFYELKNAMRIYVEKYGPELSSIGVDTWGVDFGLLDKRGNLIGIPYHYRDKRNEGTDEIIEQKMGHQKVYELTGIQFLSINTLNQVISMRRDKDPGLDISQEILFIGDILHYFMTGKVCAEYTIASISQMYDTTERRWSNEIFKAYDIPKTMQTKIVQAGEEIGTIRADLAKEVGLSVSTKIIAPGVHDTASAFAAVPAMGENWAMISSGTWSITGMEIDKPITTKECYEMNISNSGGVLGKTMFLKNVMGLWIIQSCKKVWNRFEPDLDYSEIVSRAEKATPFAGVIDPDNSVFLNPEDAAVEISEYLSKTGQPSVDSGDVGQIARIVFESLALKYRYMFERLAKATGKTIDTLHITGGGCKNEMLNQFTSNTMGLKLIAGPVEATAAGNILMQAYGTGEISSLSELRKVVRDSFEIKTYSPIDTVSWEKQYKKFLKICGYE
ncbi:MAG: rhamnulokinase [Clostridia bacterium]|nr:rhamnulokinase [Clostridia bacterium]MBN2882995.1 rhamnulokinase [Clostridia bacterium]